MMECFEFAAELTFTVFRQTHLRKLSLESNWSLIDLNTKAKSIWRHPPYLIPTDGALNHVFPSGPSTWAFNVAWHCYVF